MTRLGFFAFCAALLFASGSGATAQTIKFGTIAPKGSPWHEIVQDMAAAWSEISGGRIKLRIYPGGIAGDEPDMVRKMRVGQLDGALLTAGGLPDIAAEFRALQMPMMFASYAELDYVRDRIAPRIEPIMEARGFKVLGWGDVGWMHFFSQAPVITPDDLARQKIHAWAGSPAFVEAWKDSGFQPVPLPSTEVHMALQTKLINAIAAPPIAALSFQWFAQTGHMTDMNWVPLIGAFVITTRTWNRIPADLRPALRKAARTAAMRTRDRVRDLEDEAIRVMKEHGLTVHAVPSEIVAEWERAARAGYPRIVGSAVPADFAAEVERLRDEHRARHAEQ